MNKTLETPQGIFYLRPYRDEDMEQVKSLWNRAFNQTMDPRVWRWKFHDCPFGRQTMVCFTEDHIPIAMYAGIPVRANWEGRSICMTQVIDSMSHPAYRHLTQGRRGLFIQTAEHFYDTYDNGPEPSFFYGFPGKRHCKLGAMLLHYSSLPGGAAYLEAHLSKSSSPFFRFSSKKVERQRHASDELDELCNKAARYYPFSVVRDAQFMRWRFFDRPDVDYHVYAHRTGKGLSACAVVRFDTDAATVVDILALPDENALRDIFRVIGSQCRKKRIRTLKTWLPANHFIAGMVQRQGFRVRKEPLGIVPTIRTFMPGLDSDYAAANIYYTMADTDLL
jgi:hypothetical protein